jgi:hypothetical protein
MPLNIIMVITIVLGVMANNMVLVIQGIMIINMSVIRANIMITTATNLDTITSGVMDLVTISCQRQPPKSPLRVTSRSASGGIRRGEEVLDIIGIIVITAFRLRLK